MVFGIVVIVMEREDEKAREEKAAELKAEQVAKGTAEPTLSEVMDELKAIKAALADKHK